MSDSTETTTETPTATVVAAETNAGSVAAAEPEKPSAMDTKTAEKPAEKPKVNLDPEHFLRDQEKIRAYEEKIAAFEREKAEAVAAEREQMMKKLNESEEAKRTLESLRKSFEEETGRLRSERESELARLQKEAEAREAKLAEELDRKEKAFLSEKKTNAVHAAMVNREFVSKDAEKQVRTLLEMRFDASRTESGDIAVKDALTGKFVSEVGSSMLDDPAFAHFIKARSTGGAGATTTGTQREATPASASEPKSLLEGIFAAHKFYQGQETGALGLPFAPGYVPSQP